MGTKYVDEYIIEAESKNFKIIKEGIVDLLKIKYIIKIKKMKASEIVNILIENNIVPKVITKENIENLEYLIKEKDSKDKTKLTIFIGKKEKLNSNMLLWVENGNFVNYLANEFIKKRIVIKRMSNEDKRIIENISEFEISNKEKYNEIEVDYEIIKNIILNGDKRRADIDSYDESILRNPNEGAWELWKHSQYKNSIKIKTTKMVARNPIIDIKSDEIVGIDFGTKSTVVVHQEDREHTLPMRIGMGQFKKEINAKHYENPTVIEFVNIDKFMNDYMEKLGRPDTDWEDVTVSHTAFNSLMNSSSEHYYTVLSDLKQWAGDSNRKIRFIDKHKKDILLPAFLEIKEGDINPIEIYAYYIGLYINNRYNGIYIDYILSFPVNYEKNVREKIRESFERGLKKSLPTVLLENNEVMSNFQVRTGASEPAAYAVTALEQYGFCPKDGEKVFYGVFDFGGGTTDFDFGIWREADKNSRRYDYEIEHFGAKGDKFLGGENLLELVAFEIFKENKKLLLEKGINFIRPTQCNKFLGEEALINNISQEAKLNMKLLMEKIRPIWEKTDDYEVNFNSGIIKIDLYNSNGNKVTGNEITVSIEKVEKIIEERIEVGVKNFFEAMRLSFKNELLKDVKKINIFLAGNSSKSEIVKKLFEKYKERDKKNILKGNKEQNEIFERSPPLGSNEAFEVQKKRGVKIELNDLTIPTGKTGVAFGLIKTRKSGGKIKVINNNLDENEETKFKYYLGINKKNKLNVILDRDTEYNKWTNFIDATEQEFEIYYTHLAEATTNELEIIKTFKKKCRIEKYFDDDDINVYIRTVSPDTIEYVIARDDEIEKDKYLSKIERLIFL